MGPSDRPVSVNVALMAESPPEESDEFAMRFRDLEASDVDVVRELHEDWFPIRYNQAFYDGAARGVWAETGGPLLARLAVASPVKKQQQSVESIVGAVTASTLPLGKVDDPDLMDPSDMEHTHIMYILTLGCRASVRRRGIASALLQECLQQAARNRRCGAVYLHVKADNMRARRFYEKNGFQNLRFLQDYYMIDGQRHDAYLYIHYINNAGPQTGWFTVLARPFVALIALASSRWRQLVDNLSSSAERPAGSSKVRQEPPVASSHGVAGVGDGFSYLLKCPLTSDSGRNNLQRTMDFQDLLDEVEGAMQSSSSTSSLKKASGPSSSREASYSESSRVTAARATSKRNSIDDLLDMIDSVDDAPAPVHPIRAGSSSRLYSTDTESKSGEIKKKCTQVLLDGQDAKRGVNTAFCSHTVCANLRCNECDFTVVQFLGKKWNASADYMFFRENVPNEAKLSAKLDSAPDVVAYACQCKWLSIDVQTRVSSCRVKWSCAGH